MKIGITGAKGHIGKCLLNYPDTFSLVMDVTRPDEVEMEIKSRKPDLVVHLASVSDIDICEKKENFEWVTDVNVHGTMNVANVTEQLGIGMVFLSSDHIFDGKWFGNYKENSHPNPVNYYGLTKMTGEKMAMELYPHVKTVRTSYLFNYDRLFETIQILRHGNVHTFPTFIQRSFMHSNHFCESLYNYLQRFDTMPKVLNISGTKISSWYQFMVDLARQFRFDETNIIARPNELEMDVAPRPYRTGLNVKLSKRLGFPQYSYLDGIKELVKGL